MANMEGYRLGKTGSRVNELLERQYIVPTLDARPTESTRNWSDGAYTTSFRIGEFCRVKEDGEWKFYRLSDIDGSKYVWENADASEMPDLSNYYTKEETDRKVEAHTPDMSDYYTKDDVDKKIEASAPDLSGYYTKEEVDKKVEDHTPDLSGYYTKEEVDDKIDGKEVDLSGYYTKEEVDKKVEESSTDLSDYYTKEETDNKVSEAVSNIVIPEDESIKKVTEAEYNAMFEANTLSDKTMYCVYKGDLLTALYIGRIKIATRGEGSNGFNYNFPIIF